MAEQNTSEEKVIQVQHRDLMLAWQAMLSHEAGRLVIWSILDRAGISKVSAGMFPHFGTDQDALLRGRQQLGAELLDDFVYANDPDAYYQMLKEADERENQLSIAVELTETEGEQEDLP